MKRTLGCALVAAVAVSCSQKSVAPDQSNERRTAAVTVEPARGASPAAEAAAPAGLPGNVRSGAPEAGLSAADVEKIIIISKELGLGFALMRSPLAAAPPEKMAAYEDVLTRHGWTARRYNEVYAAIVSARMAAALIAASGISPADLARDPELARVKASSDLVEKYRPQIEALK